MYSNRFSQFAPLASARRKACALLVLSFCLLLAVGGCSRFRKSRHETVYVNAQKKYLHDRVAAVSNRIAEVENGQPLEVLDHWRRFLKVKTKDGKIGWIQETFVISDQEYQQFTQLAAQHQQDPIIATGVLRDDATLHVLPGRDTEHLYYLTANAKLHLFARASVPKKLRNTPPPAVAANDAKTAGQNKTPSSPKAPVAAKTPAAAPALGDASAQAPEQPAMEDWWLIRDGQGHIGWIMASRIDVDVPEEIGTYAEGQRIVGAYALKKIFDPEAATPNHEVTQYVTVLAPPKAGLPYDFDQVRVFTWSLKRHRYETAFRLRPIQGFLPVKIEAQSQTGAPTFSFQVGNGEKIAPDPATGLYRPKSTRTVTFALVDNTVKRLGPDFSPIPPMHLDDAKDTAKNKGKNKTNAKPQKR